MGGDYPEDTLDDEGELIPGPEDTGFFTVVWGEDGPAPVPRPRSSRSKVVGQLRACWHNVTHLSECHPTALLFIKSFFLHALGLLLPAMACGLLLWFTGIEDFGTYFASEFFGSAFAVSAVTLLCTEMMSMDFPSEGGHLRYAAGLILLVTFLIIVCGMTVYDKLGDLSADKGLPGGVFIVVSPPSRLINLVLATSVCVYLAVNDVAAVHSDEDDLHGLAYGTGMNRDDLVFGLMDEVSELRDEVSALSDRSSAARGPGGWIESEDDEEDDGWRGTGLDVDSDDEQ